MRTLYLFVFTGLLVSAQPAAEIPFEGVIQYSIKYLELPEEIAGLESMLPTKIELTVKDGFTRIEQEFMGGSQVVVTNAKDGEGFVLMDMLGQKIAVIVDKQEMDEQKLITEDIKYFEDSRIIANYKCKKATITQDGNVMEIYYTDQISALHSDFKQLKGFPLFYSTKTDGMSMELTATVIEKKSIPLELFTIPDGYIQMTNEELKGMIGE